MDLSGLTLTHGDGSVGVGGAGAPLAAMQTVEAKDGIAAAAGAEAGAASAGLTYAAAGAAARAGGGRRRFSASAACVAGDCIGGGFLALPRRVWACRHDVFISYCWGKKAAGYPGKKAIAPLVTALQAAGYRVWLDDINLGSYPAGTALPERCKIGIAQSSAMVIAFSREYAHSRMCRSEARFAATVADMPLFYVNVGAPGYEPGYDRRDTELVKRISWLEDDILDHGEHHWVDMRTSEAAAGSGGVPLLMKQLAADPRVKRSGELEGVKGRHALEAAVAEPAAAVLATAAAPAAGHAAARPPTTAPVAPGATAASAVAIAACKTPAVAAAECATPAAAVRLPGGAPSCVETAAAAAAAVACAASAAAVSESAVAEQEAEADTPGAAEACALMGASRMRALAAGARHEGAAETAQFSSVVKVVILGDSGVGKSWLYKWLRQEKIDAAHRDGSTVGTEVMTWVTGPLKVQAWDTAGQAAYRSIALSTLHGAHVVILCFDLTNPVSFANCARWLHEVNEQVPAECLVVLAGLKSDMTRRVMAAEAVAFARRHGVTYFEGSARTGAGLENVFNSILWRVLPMPPAPATEELTDAELRSRIDANQASKRQWSGANTAACERCRTPFGLFVKPHHCRVCMACVCNACSSERILDARACDKCYMAHCPAVPRGRGESDSAASSASRSSGDSDAESAAAKSEPPESRLWPPSCVVQ